MDNNPEGLGEHDAERELLSAIEFIQSSHPDWQSTGNAITLHFFTTQIVTKEDHEFQQSGLGRDRAAAILLILRLTLLGNGNRTLLPYSHRRNVARSSSVPSPLNQKSSNAFRGIAPERSAPPADGRMQRKPQVTRIPSLMTTSGQHIRRPLARRPLPGPLKRRHIRRPRALRPRPSPRPCPKLRHMRLHMRRPLARRPRQGPRLGPRPRPRTQPRPRRSAAAEKKHTLPTPTHTLPGAAKGRGPAAALFSAPAQPAAPPADAAAAAEVSSSGEATHAADADAYTAAAAAAAAAAAPPAAAF